MSYYIAKQNDSCVVYSVHEFVTDQNLDTSTDMF